MLEPPKVYVMAHHYLIPHEALGLTRLLNKIFLGYETFLYIYICVCVSVYLSFKISQIYEYIFCLNKIFCQHACSFLYKSGMFGT